MSKNEAVNTFNGGLVMDLNPVSTPNNVLTNCLNGTLVTYNGNEYTLQSDMGNGRVETAYLPSGYVPIGIKEYGGIIYVASYNPLTGKGQLGSFPSPERNISSEELNENSESILSPEDFTQDNTVVRTEIIKGGILRPGDKFSIIFKSNNNNYSQFLSNCFNTASGKIKSPKNKLLTLSAQILTDNNLYQDITSQLKRIDTNGLPKQYTSNISPDFKFNDAYFVQFGDVSGMDLDTYRKNKAANTYNNKLSGNLYLVSQLNTIQGISLELYGEVTDKDRGIKKLTLNYELKYNCPDGIYSESGIKIDKANFDSNKYLSFVGSESDFYPSNVIGPVFLTLEKVDTRATNSYSLSYKNSDSLLSFDNNLYSLRTKEDIDNISLSGLYKYTVVPSMSYSGEEWKLNGLAIEGFIDLDKLGTGEVELFSWKYFNSKDYSTISFGFNTYLRKDEVVTSLDFNFIDIITKEEYKVSYNKYRYYNGIFTENIAFNDNFQLNKAYLVKIQMHTSREEVHTFYRTLITTTLNNQYYYNTDDFIELENEPIKIVSSSTLSTSFSNSNTAKSYESRYDITQNVRKISYKVNKVVNFKDNIYPISIVQEDFKITGKNTNIDVPQGDMSLSGDSDLVNDYQKNPLKDSVAITYYEPENVERLDVEFKTKSILKKQSSSEKIRTTYKQPLTPYRDRFLSSTGYTDFNFVNTLTNMISVFGISHDEKGNQSDDHGFYVAPILCTGSNQFKVLFSPSNVEEVRRYGDYREDYGEPVTYKVFDYWGKIIQCIKDYFPSQPICISFTSSNLSGIPNGTMDRTFKIPFQSGGVNFVEVLLWNTGEDDYAACQTTVKTVNNSYVPMSRYIGDYFNNAYSLDNEKTLDKYKQLLVYTTGGKNDFSVNTNTFIELIEGKIGYNQDYKDAVDSLSIEGIDYLDKIKKNLTFEVESKQEIPFTISYTLSYIDRTNETISINKDYIEEPVILDRSLEYLKDAFGNSIKANSIYKFDSSRQGFIVDTAKTSQFKPKLVKEVMHLVPTGYGKQNINIDSFTCEDADAGDDDDRTILVFNRPAVNTCSINFEDTEIQNEHKLW